MIKCKHPVFAGTPVYSTDVELLQFVIIFFYWLCYFSIVLSHVPCTFSLAVQDERGPRKSKLPKITEINTAVPKNWTKRSKIYNKLMISLNLSHQLHDQRVQTICLCMESSLIYCHFILSPMGYRYYSNPYCDYNRYLGHPSTCEKLIEKNYVHGRARLSVYNIIRSVLGLDEYVYEIGAQIFLTSLRQCRFNESMALLPNAVQNEILNRTWHQSFVLMATFWPMNIITLLSG